MFDFVRKHTRLLQFLLLIVILPSFVLVGVEGYSRFMEGGNTAVASVDGHKITQSEWDAALRQQVERMRQQAPTMDPKVFDSPEVRKDVLENLLRERVLAAVVTDEHRNITDAQLEEIVRTDPQLAPLRGPEAKQILAQQGLTVDGVAGPATQKAAFARSRTEPACRSSSTASAGRRTSRPSTPSPVVASWCASGPRYLRWCPRCLGG